MASGGMAVRVVTLDPHEVEFDPEGTRAALEGIEELASSIAAEGLLQPIGVREAEDGRFRVVYGGRRLAAVRRLGWTAVPCLVAAEDGDPLIQQVAENILRRDLGDMEKARAFARLSEHIARALPGSQGRAAREAVGQRLGLSGRTIGRYTALLDLPEEVQDLVEGGALTVTQAQHLGTLTPPARQVALAHAAVDRGLSAAQVSRASARLAGNATLSVDAVLQALEGAGTEISSPPPAAFSAAAPEPPRLSRPSRNADEATGASEEAEFWPEDAVAAAAQAADQGPAPQGPLTQDRARVFRLRSLDSFVDEVARLTRCVQDGDLARFVQTDPEGAVKLDLAARQIVFLGRAIQELCGT